MTQLAKHSPRSRVLAAAAEIFARSGFEGARIDDIAARAGVNKSMVYYHVGEKSLIYETIVGDRAAILLRVIHDAVEHERTPERKLRAAITAFALATASNRHFAPIMLREIAAGGTGLPPKVLAKAAAVFQQFQMILKEGTHTGAFRPVDPLTTHMMIAGMVMLLVAGAPLRARLRARDGATVDVQAERSPEALAESVYELVIDGLRRDITPD